MTETLDQVLAGGLLILVAAFGAMVGYRVGKRRGWHEALGTSDEPEEASGGKRRDRQPPRPPTPPTVVH